jgi:hypothetical protein
MKWRIISLRRKECILAAYEEGLKKKKKTTSYIQFRKRIFLDACQLRLLGSLEGLVWWIELGEG